MADKGNENNGITRYIKIKVLPGPEYMLYKMLKKVLHLEDMRELFIIGMLTIYHSWRDPRQRQIIINIINDWRKRDMKKDRRYDLEQ